ncbi:DMT family transporter [Actinoallomurus liliacearum]|uniref:DMT family transporter n=1 Tax=Actinoallomurus liliacearum TaxID=1080073 RepID=A0ABP8TUD3_9ACTN
MRNHDNATRRSAVALPPGFSAAALGVLAFSFTFPATEFALRDFGPYLIGIGRAGIAAVLAAVALRLMRAPWPHGRQWASLGVVALGIVFGFPLLSTLALDHGSSSSHAAVVVGLLPVATAVFAVVRAGERPSSVFWAASLAGAALIVAFTLRNGVGRFAPADALLLGAMLTAGLGYAEGGRLAREMPGPQVVSWALVLVAPITIPVTVALFAATSGHWSGAAVTGLAYVSGVSMFLGFFAWYAGLAKAGVARASQVQLAQPLLTLLWSWLLLGEHAGAGTVVAAAGVLLCVLIAQRARVSRTAAARPAATPEVASPGAAGKG